MIIFGKMSGVYSFNTDRITTFNTTATTSKTTSLTTSYTTTFNTAFTTNYYSNVNTYNYGAGVDYFWYTFFDQSFVRWSDTTPVSNFNDDVTAVSAYWNGASRVFYRGTYVESPYSDSRKKHYRVTMATYTSKSTSIATSRLTDRLTSFLTSYLTTAATTRNTTVSTSFYE